VERAALRRFLAALDELSAAADALLAPERPHSERAAGCRVLALGPEETVAALAERLGPPFALETPSGKTLQSALDDPPDLVVGWGPEAVAAVRRLREAHPGLPVVLAAATARERPDLLSSFADDPVVLLGADAGAPDVALAVRSLAEIRDSGDPHRPATGAEVEDAQTEDPRSYPHLAGLLPRALERAIDFDVGAGVVARPGADPVADVFARSDCSHDTLERVREHALALFRLVAGGSARAGDSTVSAPPAPLQSALHVPLAADNRIVGLTYLASFRPDAFSGADEQVLSALATRASAGYRRLEASLSQLRVTPRQAQVLALVADGLSDKEVASRLGLSHRTVRTHLDRLLREHGFRSRTEAVAAWLRAERS
jgi:DNA-binding CsgD family transcriptional regulator